MSGFPDQSRVSRIVRIIDLISNAPRTWTRMRLAGHFEVSERTITADLDVIRYDLNFRVESKRGEGYYFSQIPKLPSVSYTLTEAVALILAAQSARQQRGVPKPELGAAIARLRMVIPSELRPLIQQLEHDEGADAGDDFQQEVLERVVQAISTRNAVDIEYAAASRDGMKTRRRVDPYSVVPYDRSWHVIGYCHLREDIRIFKVDRIQEINLSGEGFTPDPEFDLAAYMNEGWGIMRGVEGPVEEVVLHFWPPASRWVAEDTWHPTQRLAWRDDGSLIFRVQIKVTPEFQRWVFRHGRQVDVIQPGHLREWVESEAKAILDRPYESEHRIPAS
ncbi:MAG: helix-turn-helix transcriptional regulator [Chloroflexota bacterium]